MLKLFLKHPKKKLILAFFIFRIVESLATAITFTNRDFEQDKNIGVAQKINERIKKNELNKINNNSKNIKVTYRFIVDIPRKCCRRI